MTTVTWKGGMAFESQPPSGNAFTMDAYPDSGGNGLGPTPLEAFVSAVAACSAMDVISILAKKKQTVTSYRIEIDGDRGPEGEYPRPYIALRVKHIVEGPGLDDVAVARAVQLSDEKYCSVVSTLRANPDVSVSHETITT
jgi:putative redox protein